METETTAPKMITSESKQMTSKTVHVPDFQAKAQLHQAPKVQRRGKHQDSSQSHQQKVKEV